MNFSFKNLNTSENLYTLTHQSKQLSERLENIGLHHTIHLIMNNLIAIATYSDDSKFSNTNQRQSTLKKIFSDAHTQSLFKIGCSASEQDLRALPKAYTHAKKAISFGKWFASDTPVYFYADFIEARIAATLLNTEEHALIKAQIIKPLETYDRDYHADLCATLETCIQSETLEISASKLHIHVSTLRYRLGKINDLIGVNYFSPQGKYLLTTALMLAKLE